MVIYTLIGVDLSKLMLNSHRTLIYYDSNFGKWHILKKVSFRFNNSKKSSIITNEYSCLPGIESDWAIIMMLFTW